MIKHIKTNTNDDQSIFLHDFFKQNSIVNQHKTRLCATAILIVANTEPEPHSTSIKLLRSWISIVKIN